MVNNIVLFYKYFFLLSFAFLGIFILVVLRTRKRIVNFIIMRIYYPTWILDRYYMLLHVHLALKPFSYFSLMYIPTPPTSLANLAPPTYYYFIWPLLFLLWNPCPMVSISWHYSQTYIKIKLLYKKGQSVRQLRITLMVNLGMLELSCQF